MTLNHITVTIYNIKLGENKYFQRGNYQIYGKIQDTQFLCNAKSGSQSLWIPFQPTLGLKISHPQGQTNTYQKALNTYNTQKTLNRLKLAPTPYRLCKITLNIELYLDKIPTWETYGVYTNRVKTTSEATLKYLENLNVKIPAEFINKILKYRDYDALSLTDLILIARFHNINIEQQINQQVQQYKQKFPEKLANSPDLLTLSNILLDEKQELKVIDFDLCDL